MVGAGFSGIPVALIAQLHPIGVLVSALFFAALRAGGNRMQMATGVPSAVVGVIQALVDLFVVAAVALDLSTRIQKAQMARRIPSIDARAYCQVKANREVTNVRADSSIFSFRLSSIRPSFA